MGFFFSGLRLAVCYHTQHWIIIKYVFLNNTKFKSFFHKSLFLLFCCDRAPDPGQAGSLGRQGKTPRCQMMGRNLGKVCTNSTWQHNKTQHSTKGHGGSHNKDRAGRIGQSQERNKITKKLTERTNKKGVP